MQAPEHLIDPVPGIATFTRTPGSPLDILIGPDFSAPTHLRPCCIFGHDLKVQLGAIGLPLAEVNNLVAATDLGEHVYNGGLVSPKHGVREGFLTDEENGLVYTCRGGFVDIAHVRDYVDWTLFIGAQIARNLETGLTLILSDEGGARRVVLEPVETS